MFMFPATQTRKRKKNDKMSAHKTAVIKINKKGIYIQMVENSSHSCINFDTLILPFEYTHLDTAGGLEHAEFQRA